MNVQNAILAFSATFSFVSFILILFVVYEKGKTSELGEWQLCPKCNGDGHLGRYNSPNLSTTVTPVCDVCNGSKIIQKPIKS